MTVQARSAAKDGGGWPPGLSQPLPRRVQLRRSQIYVLCAIGTGLLILLAFAGLLGFAVTHRTSQLLAHGVHAQGTIRALHSFRGKGGPSYQVDYGFTDPAPPDPIEAIQSGKSGVSEAQFRSLFVGEAIDVVFLPLRPDISMLEISLVTASRDPWELLEIATVTFSWIATPGALPFAWFYWRERRLLQWGQHTAATVRDVRTKKRGSYAINSARFEFLDSTGITCQGLARYVGTASQQVVGSSTRSFAAGDTATVLYDPGNPARADLYPLQLLTLAPE